MNIFKFFKYSAKIRFISVIAAMICSVLFFHIICSGYEASEQIDLRIVAYQGIGIAVGQYSAEQIEEDIRTLTDKGYTPLFASQVADILDEACDIPQKAVVLTFDGGCSAYYNQLLPILKKYRFKAVITVNGKRTEYSSNSADDNTSYLRWEEIKEMDRTNLVEFSNGAFSFDTADSFEQKQYESYEQYRSRIISDIGQTQFLFQLNCDFEPCVFTYPDGIDSDITAGFVKSLGFRSAMKLENKPVIVNGKNKADPYRLKRYERADYDSITDIIG